MALFGRSSSSSALGGRGMQLFTDTVELFFPTKRRETTAEPSSNGRRPLANATR